MFERIRERLGLTDDQVAQIKAQLQPERETLTDLILRLHDAKVPAPLHPFLRRNRSRDPRRGGQGRRGRGGPRRRTAQALWESQHDSDRRPAPADRRVPGEAR